MRTLIAVKDNEGNVYTMPSNTDKCIIEIHYSTSYYTFVVQNVAIREEDGKEIYPKSTIIVPINKDNWIDFLAVKESEIGELVEEEMEV